MNDAIVDFAAYSIHDGLKARSIPSMDSFVGNAVVSAGYNIVGKPFLNDMVEKVIPGQGMYGQELVKFVSEGALWWAYMWARGKDKNLKPLLLKQLLSQGGVVVYKQFGSA